MSGFNYLSPSNATVMVGDISYLFYVNSSSNLGYLWFKGLEYTAATESGNTSNAYEPRTLIRNENPVSVNQKTPQVTAVSYRSNNGDSHIRLYYTNSECYLCELCADIKDVDAPLKWFEGSLNVAGYRADEHTALASLVQVDGTGQVKVYYKGNNQERFWCAYANVGSTNWSQREVFNKK